MRGDTAKGRLGSASPFLRHLCGPGSAKNEVYRKHRWFFDSVARRPRDDDGHTGFIRNSSHQAMSRAGA